MTSLSVGDSLRASWALTKKHFKFLFLVLLAMIGLSIVQEILQAIAAAILGKGIAFIIISVILAIIFIVINVVLAVGLINMYLKIVDGGKPSWGDLLEKANLSLRCLGAGILVGLILLLIILVIGILTALIIGVLVQFMPHGILVVSLAIALAIAAIVVMTALMLRYALVSYLVIDKGYRARQAIRESVRLTKGHRWMVFRFGLASVGVILLGILCLIVGLFWAIPTARILMTSLYRQLSEKDTSPIAGITAEPIAPAMPVEEIHASETVVA